MFPVWRRVLENVSDPEGKPDGADRVGEGQAGLAIPGCGVWGGGRVQQIAGPQRDEAVEAEQCGRCSCDCLVGPLPLGFDAEMCPGFCKGDFDLPTANEECDDVSWRLGGVGTEEGLWVALAIGVSDQHPADCSGRCARAIPKGGIGGDLERFFLLSAIPGGHGYSAPGRGGI